MQVPQQHGTYNLFNLAVKITHLLAERHTSEGGVGIIFKQPQELVNF